MNWTEPLLYSYLLIGGSYNSSAMFDVNSNSSSSYSIFTGFRTANDDGNLVVTDYYKSDFRYGSSITVSDDRKIDLTD